MVIEQHGPAVPDRQVHLATGFPDFPGTRMIAQQPQRRFEGQPRSEQPVRHDVVHLPGNAVMIRSQAHNYLRPDTSVLTGPTGRAAKVRSEAVPAPLYPGPAQVFDGYFSAPDPTPAPSPPDRRRRVDLLPRPWHRR